MITVKRLVMALLVVSSSVLLYAYGEHLSSSGVPVSEASQTYVDDRIQEATAAFLLARTLNAAISVLQSSEVEFSAMLVSGTIQPGELLDPVNDLIERFSLVMLVCLSALTIYKLIITLASPFLFKIAALSALLAGLALMLKFDGLKAGGEFFSRCLTSCLFVICLIPLFSFAGEQTSRVIMTAGHVSQSIETMNDEYAGLVEAEELSVDRFSFSTVKKIYVSLMDVHDNILKYISVFVVQDVLLPLVALFLSVRMIGCIWRTKWHLSSLVPE